MKNHRSFIEGIIRGLAVIIPSYALIYGAFVLQNGSWNYRNWPRIREERRIEEKQALEKRIITDFYRADLDSSGFLDLDEFYKFMKK